MLYQTITGVIRPSRLLMTNVRALHTSRYCLGAVDKNALSQLRKKTGYPFINCRNALVQFDNDINKAEEWLVSEAQKQGWAKATKLEGRTMAQGLIGVMVEKNVGAITEVSCETDFVARNAKFQDLVKAITRTCLQTGKRVGANKVYFGQNELNQLETGEGGSVADQVALVVGSLGENMQARRAAVFSAPDSHQLSFYVHKAGITVAEETDCQLGKYGALLTYRQTTVPADSQQHTTVQPDSQQHTTDQLARQLCQHIVGMNPQTHGSPEDQPAKNADEETKLIHQEFLLDPDVKVSEFLLDNGLEVQSWVRYECGEK